MPVLMLNLTVASHAAAPGVPSCRAPPGTSDPRSDTSYSSLCHKQRSLTVTNEYIKLKRHLNVNFRNELMKM